MSVSFQKNKSLSGTFTLFDVTDTTIQQWVSSFSIPFASADCLYFNFIS